MKDEKARRTVRRFPKLAFDADEVSAGVYKVTAIHNKGYRYENTGLDPDKLLDEAKDWARKVEGSHQG